MKLWAAAATAVCVMAGVSGCAEPAVVEPDAVVSESPTTAPPVGDGTVVQLTVESEALGTSQAVTVYEPAGLEDSGPVPVVYLLHGQRENNLMWTRAGVAEAADRLIAAGEMAPTLLVMPDIDNSFGVNNTVSEKVQIPGRPAVFYDGNAYEDFLAEDLIAYIDHTYDTVDDRSGRYVGGISMGGFAALHLAMRHPDLFSRVGGHSPALVTDRAFTWLYPEDVPEEERDPFLLAQTADLSGLAFYLDVGDEDEWGFRPPTEELAQLLESRGADVRFELGEGGHDFPYWTAHLEDYLRFYADGND